ncbi:hypothetical protein ACFSUS_02575 [Spirosoma soli]|uniref:DUF2508 family protein n=1 Tax=Spirosoma soli TaxID=1770529 RepID=A0ABW5LXJ2_9BACT
MEAEELPLDVHLNDLLRQIRQLDEMIEFHRNHSSDSSMISQYEYMKADYIDKANQTLKAYRVKLIATPV